jgi:hypothetical protein
MPSNFVSRKRDMIDIHVDAHADRVGRDEEIHFARLIERDLRIARAGAQRAEHDGRASALAAHEIGDAVNVLRRERDDGRAAGQAGEFLGAGISEIGKARPRDEMRLGHEALDRSAHRLRAEEQRLLVAAGVEQPVGEDMPALGIAAKLDLVDGEKRHAQIERHGLDRADEIARLGRHDLLFAGDEGRQLRALIRATLS